MIRVAWPVIRWERCPVVELRAPFQAYVERGELPPPAHPIIALLENDWCWSVMLSDVALREAMLPLAAWMHHELPPHVWGSRAAVMAWQAEFRERAE